MESYETDTSAQFPTFRWNHRGSNQFTVLQTDPQGDDIGSEVAATSTDLRAHDALSSVDGFSFKLQSEPLSISDRVKNYIQAFTSLPIIWWPFSNPRRPLKQGKTRMTWQCVRKSSFNQYQSANYANRLHVLCISQLIWQQTSPRLWVSNRIING